jgi:ABC-2 type transport system ATP-binding protein
VGASTARRGRAAALTRRCDTHAGSAEFRGSGVTVRGLVKAFRGTTVLDGVDLDVPQGRLHAVVGRNGAGKSTLLRVLATTVLPEAGTASIAGIDVLASPRAARAQIGLCLADERSWYWPLTGRQNLDFFGRLHGLRSPDREARCAQVLSAVGLDEPADRSFNDYSTGMRLRLSVARALLHDPAVLLLDEPTRSVDPPGAAAMLDLLRDQVAAGRTVVLVTHDLEEAAQADGATVLDGGRVVAQSDARPERSELAAALSETPR